MTNNKRLKLKSAIKVALMVRPQILDTHVDRLDLIADAVTRVFEEEIGKMRYLSRSYTITNMERIQAQGDPRLYQSIKERLAKDIMYAMLDNDIFDIEDEKRISGNTITMSIVVLK